MDILKDLENIINNPKKNWKDIEVLIEDYKKKQEDQQKFGMQMMALVLNPGMTGSLIPYPKPSVMKKVEEFDNSQTETIHCILEDLDVDIENCKKCDNRCVEYKKYLTEK